MFGPIFYTGLLTGALYLPFTLQMMIGATFLSKFAQAIPFFFFPVCWSLVGLGFLRKRGWPLWLEAGVSLAVFFALSLFMPIQSGAQAQLISRFLLCWIPAGFIYLAIGRELGARLSLLGTRVHMGYGVFLLGALIGGVFSDQTVTYLGGNGLLVTLIVAIFASRLPRRSLAVAIPVVTALAVFYSDADLHIERRRNVGRYDEEATIIDRSNVATTRQHLQNYATEFEKVRWNRRGQTFMGYDEVAKGYYGVMNLQIEYTLPFKSSKGRGRTFLHSQFKPGEDILLIGVGSGRSFLSIPDEIKGPNLVGIERDQNAIDLTRELNLNDDMGGAQYIGGDGRAYLEQSNKLWNWIVIESALDRKTARPVSLFRSESLFTPEALDAYIAHLKPGGTLVVEIHRFGWRRPRTNILHAIADHLESRERDGIQVVYVNKKGEVEVDSGLWIYARKGGAPLLPEVSGASRKLASFTMDDVETARCIQKYSDAAPFINWMCMRDENGIWLYVYSGLAILLFGAMLWRARRESHEGLTWTQWTAFHLQSAAHCFLFFAASYRFRSIFRDDLATFYIFTFATTFVSAVASFYLQWLVERGRQFGATALAAALFIGLAILYFVQTLPLTFEGPLIVRVALFAVGVAPVYFASSLLFHRLLRPLQARPLALRQAFLCDSIAFLPAYALVPWVLFGLGLNAMFFLSMAFYALTFALLAFGQRRVRLLQGLQPFEVAIKN